jgi:hypothetical protein
VAAWQEALLGTGDVETDNAVVAVTNGKFGDLETPVGVTHCGNQLAGANETAVVVDVFHALLEAILNGFDNLVKGQAALQVLLWSPTNLTIDDAIFGKVVHEFASHTL